jgi:hypothetical protein
VTHRNLQNDPKKALEQPVVAFRMAQNSLQNEAKQPSEYHISAFKTAKRSLICHNFQICHNQRMPLYRAFWNVYGSMADNSQK